MRHAKIAIIGAGAVGSATAYAIMWKNIAAEIILVDLDKKRCRGEILDLSDAIPFSCTSCLSQGTPADAGQADIIIIAAGARRKPGQTREELLDINWKVVSSVIESMKPINKQAILIMVTNPVDIMAYCAQQCSGLPKEQVFGSGTLLDTQRLRGIISKRIGVAEQSIQAFVLGAHGQVQFAAWSCASIAGIPIHNYPNITPAILEIYDQRDNWPGLRNYRMQRCYLLRYSSLRRQYMRMHHFRSTTHSTVIMLYTRIWRFVESACHTKRAWH